MTKYRHCAVTLTGSQLGPKVRGPAAWLVPTNNSKVVGTAADSIALRSTNYLRNDRNRKVTFGWSAVKTPLMLDRRNRPGFRLDVNGLGGSAFVTVVQTAHCRHLDYFALGDELYSSCFRGVFAQRQMSSPVMVIAALSRERAPQRALVEYDDMIQAFAANGANEPLHICTLPWREGRREYLFDPHRLYLVDELLSEDPIAVAQQIAWHTLPRKSIPKLLYSPLRCRMRRDSKLENAPPIMRQH